MFGYSESEIIGQPGDILFTPADRGDGAAEREAEIAFRTGKAENERWQSRKDGSLFYGSGLVMPLKDDAGKNLGLVKIIRDLTLEKRAHDELERFNRAAVGQETQIIDLKKEINEMAEGLGEKARYKVQYDEDPKQEKPE